MKTLLILLALGSVETIHMPRTPQKELFPVSRCVYVDPVVIDISGESGVPLDILYRLITSESSWRPHVRSAIRQDGTYDIGLAQINVAYLDYFTAQYMEGALDPLHPVDSLRFAARYLRDLHDKTGNWEDAVVAYKSGLGRVGREPAWVRQIAAWVVRG